MGELAVVQGTRESEADRLTQHGDLFCNGGVPELSWDCGSQSQKRYGIEHASR